MFRPANKTIIWAALLCTLAACSLVFGSEGKNEPSLCREDQVVVVPSISSRSNDIYDGNGNLLGNMSNYTGSFMPYISYRDSLTTYRKDDKIILYSVKKRQVVGEFPADSCRLVVQGNAAVMVEYTTGRYQAFDTDGEIIYEGWAPSSPEEEWKYIINIYKTSQGYLLSFFIDYFASVSLIDEAGGSRELTDPDIRAAARDSNMIPFGNYLFLYSYEDDQSKVVDLDGTVLIDQVSTGIYEQMGQDGSAYGGWYMSPLRYVAKRTGDWFSLYNEDLNLAGMRSATDEYLTASGYFIPGVMYSQLGGTCQGFASYGSQTVPYAKTVGGYNCWRDGVLEFLPVPEGEELDSYNDAYIMTKFKKDPSSYRTSYRVYRRNGSLFYEESDSDDITTYFSLESSGLLVSIFEDISPYTNTFILYDNQGNETYRTDKGYVYSWANGYWFMRRGVYYGLTSIDGSWVVKHTMWEE